MESGQRRWSAVSRHIIIAVIVEIVTVGSLLLWWGDLNVWFSLALALAIIFLFRIIIALLSFVLAWWFRSPLGDIHSLSIVQYLGMVLREIGAFMKLFFIFHPLEPLLNKHDPQINANTPQRPILLLVHGFFSNAGFWVSFKRHFAAQGLHALYTINLDPEFVSIDTYADQLAARVEQICAIHHRQKLILVGHSMGGLVCRAYVDRYNPETIHKVITLGSPHHGTLLAYLLHGPNLFQMRPHNRWLNRLNAKASDVTITTHYSVHDNIIVPQNSARLEGAATFVLAGIGHLSMAFSPAVMNSVLEDIRPNDQKT